MVKSEDLTHIFSNIDMIYNIQDEFLKELVVFSYSFFLFTQILLENHSENKNKNKKIN